MWKSNSIFRAALLAFSIVPVGITVSGLFTSCNPGNVPVERYANIKVQFVNSSTGWIVGPRLLQTRDGGRTWTSVSRDETGTFKVEDIFIGRQKIQFISPDMGWSVGGDGIAKTVNGGRTWSSTKITSSQEFPLQSLFFISSQEGWVVGKDVYHTSDGGQSWQELSKTPEGNPQRQVNMRVAEENANYNPALWFTTVKHGFMGRLDGEVYETNDAGKTWKIIWTLDRSIEDVFFWEDQYGWMSDSEGFVSKTIDGGRNWISVPTPAASSLNSVFFINAQTGWAVGTDAAIVYTKDGGATWKKASINGLSKPFPPLASVSFLDELHGFAVGGLSDPIDQSSRVEPSNVVLATDDGGMTWHPVQL
jgi:photosystem II stability/assembly factor-like uncharacterized protein